MLFGVHPVEEALLAGSDIDKIMVARDQQHQNIRKLLKLAGERNVYVQKVPKEKLNRLTKANHQGVVAFVSPVTFYDIEMLLPEIFEKGETPFFLLLDGVTDTRNLGALARTAESAGVHAIILPQKGSAPISADAVKTSAGALLKVPVCKVADAGRTVKYLQDSGLMAIACTEKASESIYHTNYTGPVVIILGDEEKGISDRLIRLADRLVSIPMTGSINSLNVSVAGAIILYEVIRQRYKSNPGQE